MPMTTIGPWLPPAAATRLRAGTAPDQVARNLGESPAGCVAVHATVVDLADPPLEARRLQGAAQVLHSALGLPGTLQAQGPGWRASLRCGGRDAPALRSAAANLQLFALQRGNDLPVLQWFGGQGDAAWQWRPAVGDAALFDALVRSAARPDRRPSPMGLGGRRPAAAMSRDSTSARPQRLSKLPPGVGWDLLLHAAAQGLPLQLAFAPAAHLVCAASTVRVCLDGQVLCMQAGAHTVWLDESADWTADERHGSACVGGSLSVSHGEPASRADACAWRTALAAARRDQPLPSCTC